MEVYPAHPLPQLGHVLVPEALMRWIISRDGQFSGPMANLLFVRAVVVQVRQTRELTMIDFTKKGLTTC